MRFPLHLLRASTFRSEPGLAALAAIAVGMFVGTWIIGPAVTRSVEIPCPAQERATFEDWWRARSIALSRRDPCVRHLRSAALCAAAKARAAG